MNGRMIEIKGFPGYLYDKERAEFVSKRQKSGGLVLKVTERNHVPMVTMFQDGRQRGISVNRMIFAIQNGIGYDDIPNDVFIKKDENDGFVLYNSTEMADFARKAVERSKNDRLAYIREKIKRLRIMESVYETGKINDAVMYVEKWKEWLIAQTMRQNNCKRERAELLYSWAFDELCYRLKGKKYQITDVVLYCQGLMRKFSLKYNAREKR